jgi:purine catabolism regulator
VAHAGGRAQLSGIHLGPQPGGNRQTQGTKIPLRVPAATRFRDLHEEAVQTAETAATFGTRARPFYRFADVRLRGVPALMHDDVRLRFFAEAKLVGILDPLDGPALELLGLYLQHGGNQLALTCTRFLSRPALYARFEKLEDNLGVSLDGAEPRPYLHVALLWIGLGRP